MGFMRVRALVSALQTVLIPIITRLHSRNKHQRDLQLTARRCLTTALAFAKEQPD